MVCANEDLRHTNGEVLSAGGLQIARRGGLHGPKKIKRHAYFLPLLKNMKTIKIAQVPTHVVAYCASSDLTEITEVRVATLVGHTRHGRCVRIIRCHEER